MCDCCVDGLSFLSEKVEVKMWKKYWVDHWFRVLALLLVPITNFVMTIWKRRRTVSW